MILPLRALGLCAFCKKGICTAATYGVKESVRKLENISIYQRILENVTPEGSLPKNFSLPEEDETGNGLRFSPGARDGIGLFASATGNAELAAKELEQLLRKVLAEDSPFLVESCSMKEPETELEKQLRGKMTVLLQQYGALELVDPVLEAIRNERGQIAAGSIPAFACRLAFESMDAETVKLGIALLGLVDIADAPELMNKLVNLALFEEFTLYVAATLSQCETGNMLLFGIAQKVDGWGKIYAVGRLEPQTEEIKAWLLRHGCENTVSDAYLGLVCAEKGDMVSALNRGNMDDELFEGISVIVDALLDEGPTEGISAYQPAQEALLLYLQFARTRVATVKQLWRILNLQDWLVDSELADKTALMSLCKEITAGPSWAMQIQRILRTPAEEQSFFYAVSAAKRLGADVGPALFGAVKANPIKHSGYVSWLYAKPEYAAELTRIYERTLPLDEMERGMGDALFASSLQAEHHCLDFVLQELCAYPNTGESLIEAALLSPVVRERHIASKVLEEWRRALGKPLADISPVLYSTVKEVALAERDGDLKERMEGLLEGIG